MKQTTPGAAAELWQHQRRPHEGLASDSALPQAALPAAQGPVAGPLLGGPTVVAKEDQDGGLQQPIDLLDGLGHVADALVHDGKHCCVHPPLLVAQVREASNRLIGCLKRRVHGRIRQVQKERGRDRTPHVALDELHRLRSKEVRGIHASLSCVWLVVLPQVQANVVAAPVRVVEVVLRALQEAIPPVEAPPCRDEVLSPVSQVPLANAVRDVALALQEPGQCGLVRRQSVLLLGEEVRVLEAQADRIPARHERRPGGPADGLDVEVRQPDTLGRQLVDPRRPDVVHVPPVHPADVVRAQVVGEDQDDVRRLDFIGGVTRSREPDTYAGAQAPAERGRKEGAGGAAGFGADRQ
mmetsp:Transcript_46535/g.124378  ORF Transcript_46535/g.124378 Transcript_46535/m.124378 type:complete len:353 (-) Transcript_46535:42-1100(-)